LYAVLDAIEVKNGIYSDDSVLGCGVPDNSSTSLKIIWLKDGQEIHTDNRRVVALHKYPDYSTLTFDKIGNIALCTLTYDWIIGYYIVHHN